MRQRFNARCIITDYLDLADYMTLLALRQTDMQGKQMMQLNSRSPEAIQLYETAIEEADEFPYLGSKMTSDGSCDAEIKSRLSKLSQASDMLKSISRAGKLSL